MKTDFPLDELTQLISNATDSFTTALFFQNQQADRFYLASCYSLSNNIDTGYTFSEGEGFWGWVVKHGKPLNISPFAPDYKPLAIYRSKEDIKSFLAVPLENGAGVLSVDSKATYVFTDRVAKLLMDFGRLAVSLNRVNGRLHNAETDQRLMRFLIDVEDRLEGNNAMGEALETVLAFFRASFVFFAVLIEGGGLYYVRSTAGRLKSQTFLAGEFPVEEGLVGWIFRKGQPLLLKKLGGDSRKSFLFTPREPPFNGVSFAGVPAKFGSTVYGVLGLVTGEQKKWSVDEIKALKLVSSLLGSAM